MGEAYLPGLTVATKARLRRLLSVPTGEITVEPGRVVDDRTAVALVNPRGYLHFIDLYRELDLGPDATANFLLKRVGDRIRKGEVIARRGFPIEFLRREVKSPVTGTIERISPATGRVSVREDPVPVRSFYPGRVAEVRAGEGVVIELVGAIVQGIFGVGGQASGPVVLAVDGPDEILSGERVGPEHAGMVVIGGSLASGAALRRAVEFGVRAVVVGGADKKDVDAHAGRVIGVAVTGNESVGTVLVLTEGFGRWPMSEAAFAVLRRNRGRTAYVSGRTQVRAGVIRPEVIIPLDGPDTEAAAQGGPPDAMARGLEEGARVRIIRGPYFGRLGVVRRIRAGLTALETGAMVRTIEVTVDAGGETEARPIVLPRCNVELYLGDADADASAGGGKTARSEVRS